MTGLTPFLIAMIRAPRQALATASAARLAAKYDLPVQWVAFYLETWVSSPVHRSK